MRSSEYIMMALCGVNCLLLLLVLLKVSSKNQDHNQNESVIDAETLKQMTKDIDEYTRNQVDRIKELVESQNNLILKNIESIHGMMDRQLSDMKEHVQGFSTSNREQIASLTESVAHSVSGLRETVKDMKDSNSQVMHSIAENITDNLSHVRAIIENMSSENKQHISQLSQSIDTNLKEIKGVVDEQLQATLDKRLNEAFHSVNEQIAFLTKSVANSVSGLRETVKDMQDSNQQIMHSIAENVTENLRNIRSTVENMSSENEKHLSQLSQNVNNNLKEIKGVVDEQLQTTLDRKLNESFHSVVEQLSNVQRGLGEMQTIANSVGDLKKTLSNVKTRGIWGEIFLGQILDEILSSDQYDKNVVTVKGSREPVEYAVKLPAKENEFIYLPIDSKFPADTYNALLDAYESGNPAHIEECGKKLENRILQEGKDISTKYIHAPETTDFAIMFLPVEGLYAEVVKRGWIEKLQSKYKVCIAGPTTMGALLNSLHMGFRTLAIQQRSSEVWAVLEGVKTEFKKYQKAIEDVRKRLQATDKEFDELVGVRTRMINRRLDKITAPVDLDVREVNRIVKEIETTENLEN